MFTAVLNAIITVAKLLNEWLPVIAENIQKQADETRALRVSQERQKAYDYAKQKASNEANSAEFNRLVRNPPSFDS